MHRFKYLALFAFLLLSACVKPSTGTDENSTFFISDVSGSAMPVLEHEAVWKSVPRQVHYIFQACATGRASHKELYNQDFTIENPNTNPKEFFPAKSSAKKGCFNWEEDIPFNYFAGKSGWVTIERYVVGRGLQTGRQRVLIGINPWAVGDRARDHGKPVVSLLAGERENVATVFPSASAAKNFLEGVSQGGAELLVQEVRVRAIPKSEGSTWVAALYEVEMEPIVRSMDASGRLKYEKILDGQYDVMVQVMGADVGAEMNKKVLLLAVGDKPTVAPSVNGKLKVEVRLRQDWRPNQSNLELVLRVTPKGLSGNHGLQPFNGLFRFGPGTEVQKEEGSLANVCLEQKGSCDYHKIISSATNYDELEKQGYLHPNKRYIFSNLKLRFNSIVPGETTTQRTVSYIAQTCITDNQTGRPLAKTPMIIRYVKQNDGRVDVEPPVTRKETDDMGCLSWNGEAFHKYYEPEEYFPKEVVIEKGQNAIDASGEQVPSFETHLKFYLNPWDDKFTFGFDARDFSPQYIKDITTRQKIRSRFFLGDYNYRTVRFLYNIDHFMDLEVHKWVLMGLTPQVLRYSGIINARKMVEHLRDGIYLMKVAIQKSYLDPRDNSGWLLRNNPEHQAELVSIGGKELAAKEYITTNSALVRVVDGVIIYPMEFIARDLRLMRVRSNMVIQLETVDERLVQAYHVFRKQFSNSDGLEQSLREFKEKLKDGQPASRELGTDDAPLEMRIVQQKREVFARSPDLDKARADLEAKIKQVQKDVKSALTKLKKQFDEGGNLGLDSGPTSLSYVKAGQSVESKFDLRPELLNELKTVLKINDFSTVSLPKREEIDLDIFAENNSGLEKRSFVGPVIFLSNAYSDSVRATDNLDEAKCIKRDEKGNIIPKDALARSLEDLELDVEGNKLISDIEDGLKMNRQNNAYQYNKYFGSLNNMCDISVDDLIQREKKLNYDRLQTLELASLKYSFAQNFGMDFVSLTDEPLKKLRPDCKGEVAQCLEVTNQDTIKAEALKKLVHEGLEDSMSVGIDHETLEKMQNFQRFRPNKFSWSPEEYEKLFFERNLDSKASLCNLLGNKIARQLVDEKLTWVGFDAVKDKIVAECSYLGLVHNVLLRVEQTGKYTFLGGLNLNFNVGEGFSVGTSSGWSAGFDFTDVVGGPMAALAGSMGSSAVGKFSNAIKPVSVKWGTSMSSGEGTSISESTYLVSQIAGFDVELQDFERCAAIRLTPRAIERLLHRWDNGFYRFFDLSVVNSKKSEVIKAVRRGLFVCEGATRTQNRPQTVKESYFYFTQHFTEGDMLDQADLYNNPWLYALRGMRDFSTFVRQIRAQEIADLGNFLYHVTNMREPRTKGWALEHLNNAYKNILPGLPGYYTVLNKSDGPGFGFVLEQARKPSDFKSSDPLVGLGEVDHKTLMKQNKVDEDQKSGDPKSK